MINLTKESADSKSQNHRATNLGYGNKFANTNKRGTSWRYLAREEEEEEEEEEEIAPQI
jgi:hypothetical protein